LGGVGAWAGLDTSAELTLMMITVLLLVGVASARADRYEFSEYKLTFNKLYSNAEAEAKAFRGEYSENIDENVR
jgi:hypothetical protein